MLLSKTWTLFELWLGGPDAKASTDEEESAGAKGTPNDNHEGQEHSPKHNRSSRVTFAAAAILAFAIAGGAVVVDRSPWTGTRGVVVPRELVADAPPTDPRESRDGQTPIASRVEMEEDPCIPSPCLNGGTCTVEASAEAADDPYRCQCAYGWEGLLCETRSTCDPSSEQITCVSSPCQNGGVLSFNEEDMTYSCLPSPCQNGGIVTFNEADWTYSCDCQPGWLGQHCNLSAGDCVEITIDDVDQAGIEAKDWCSEDDISEEEEGGGGRGCCLNIEGVPDADVCKGFFGILCKRACVSPYACYGAGREKLEPFSSQAGPSIGEQATPIEAEQGSCHGHRACAHKQGQVGERSCLGEFACYKSTGDIGKGSCTEFASCDYTTCNVPDNECSDHCECAYESLCDPSSCTYDYDEIDEVCMCNTP